MKLARLAFAAPVLVFGADANAVRNPDQLDERPVEVAAGDPARLNRSASWRAPIAADGAWKSFLARRGRWTALWDGETGVPTRIYGEGIAAPGSIADAAVAEAAARRVLADELALIAPGASIDDFELLANQLHADGTRRTVSFAQHAGGLRVLGGAVSFLFGHDRLFVIGSQAVPHIRATQVAQPISAATAAAAATTWISDLYGGVPALLGVDARALLPVIHQQDDGAGVEYRTVVPVTVDLAEPRGRWVVYVDAATGAPVARRQTLMFAEGTIKYKAPVRYTGSSRADYPAQFASHTIAGGTVTGDADGKVTWTGTSAASVTSRVSGPYVAVTNASGSTVTGALSLSPGGTAIWDLSGTERSDAQLSAFVHANLIKQFALSTLDSNLGWLEGSLSVSVNESGNCNAYSTGDDIHFYVESSQCNNTARLADVVYHEFGHSIHANAIIPGAGEWDGALSEGVSDYLAATYVGDPKMGRGFFKSEAPLRDLDPTSGEWSWPDDNNGQVHDTGRIIGGTLWDLRVALQEVLGDAPGQTLADDLYYAVIARASDIPSSYVEVLAGDDDDGDLTNGTPHKCVIDEVFAAHGLADPSGAAAGSIAPPTRDDRVLTLLPEGGAGVCPPPSVASARATWRLRADPATTGQVDFADAAGALTAELPDQTGVVQYQVAVTFEDGTTQTFPKNPADPWYEAYLGGVTVIACSDFEADDGWVLDGFAIGAPNATANASDPAAAFDGASVLGTDLGEDGGDGDYEPSSNLSATSPIYEIPGTWDEVRLHYRRWLNVEDATFDDATISVDGTALWGNLMSAAGGDTHHRDREWRFQDVDLTAQAADGQVELTFGLTSDEGLEYGGWTIDQVCIVAIGAGVCGDSLVSPGEGCDDGNDVDGDGCSACVSDDPPDDGEDPPDDGEDPPDGEDPGDVAGGCCSTGSGGVGGSLGLAALTVLMLLSRHEGRRDRDRRRRRRVR